MARFVFAVVTITGICLLIRKAIKTLVREFLESGKQSRSRHGDPN
jgi:hypothetical protein